MAQYRGWISKISLRAASAALPLLFVLALVLGVAQPAHGQTYKEQVLHNFTGGADGAYPVAGLVQDARGNLYGTTYDGGVYGDGTAFRLNPTGKEKVLHSFVSTGNDRRNPAAGLIWDAVGNLYGTTDTGGNDYLYGTVYKLSRSGTETVLYSFTGGADGAQPYAVLVRDKAGNLYSTTFQHGSSGLGVVFKVDTSGTETVLHNFTGYPTDGASPVAGVVRDAEGNFYGTTAAGGSSSYGIVFKLDKTGKETVLHNFTGVDGKFPYAGLVQDGLGNLYGTTSNGGTSNRGTVFKLDASGKETVLHNFRGYPNDGSHPIAGLVQDKAGNFYGTTSTGGSSSYGTVFKLSTTGKEIVLHSFTEVDGETPAAGLIRDAKGNFYGTTQYGGVHGYGTVFKLTPQ